ncbi:DUF3857 domain-containing protein [Polaribacter sp. Hel_I_88]|uniref:DUF3857 domain-containing protein n=1 Tax=Polaribacter sp. Hel_I_88 TaxID=1250006 RepID=UPI00068EF999|nr:DUF3857 domain-containing protein [Polaribacter sp. Hel_I_88]
MKKKILLLTLLFSATFLNSQVEKSSKMGQTSLDELAMTVYDKDSTATAVVLYEHANIYLDKKNGFNTRTDFYYRIKILDQKAFDLANVVINSYKKEKIIDLKAITYNISENGKIQTTNLNDNTIFKVEESEAWTAHKFTFPNIKVGSVLEYSYSKISPYSGIDDWYFQSDIPKIKSEFDAAILGNYKYNIRIIGYLNLDKDEPSINKKCIYIDGLLGDAACAIYSYGMYDVPAFKEEDFMLSKKNYVSRLTFDLKSYTSPRGKTERYTTTWKEADKKLKDIFFNNQTSKKGFFKRRIPEDILAIENQLEKAKSIYTFIQNHYSWNEKYWNSEDEKVKDAFEDRSGSAGEINLSLFNALEAADIEAELVILSTRNHGLPTTLYPVIFDFNYVVIKTTINGKEYYLDATDKFSPFGQVPLRTLNGQARVINFKKESNWVVLQPKTKSSINTSAKLKLNENGNFVGNLLTRRIGYIAQNQREKLSILGKNNYIKEFEEDNSNIEVDSYEVHFKDNLEKPLQEIFEVTIFMNDELTQKARINPFFFNRLKENPFKLKERNYPVDFGFAKSSTFTLSLEVPDTYKVTQLPEQMAISLPNNSGTFLLKTVNKGNVVNVITRFSLNKKTYSSEEYFSLKEFFKRIVIAESSYIIIEKK